MNRLKPIGIRTKHILLVPLTVALVLAGIGTCRRNILQMDLKPSKPGFTMKQLDTKAKPFIDEAYAAVPKAVADLCSDKTGFLWLLLKDKAMGTTKARDRIASVVNRRITPPLGKAAAIYKCAANTDAAVGMARDVAIDNLSRRLYASVGIAVEAVCVKTTLASCTKVIAHCAPKLASSWGLLGTCAAADGPLPIGDVVGVGLAVGGTAWCYHDLRKASKNLPRELSDALRAAIASTIAQCRQEAASAL